MLNSLRLQILAGAAFGFCLLCPVRAAAETDLNAYQAQKPELEAALTLARAGKNQEALERYGKLSESGNPVAAYLRVSILLKTEKDEAVIRELRLEQEKIFPPVRELAVKNDPLAQNLVSAAYYTGDSGLKKNLEDSTAWLRKSAEQGYPQAQYNLANAYQRGEVVAKDPGEAAQWYRKAAEQGHPGAQGYVGVEYLLAGRISEALRWLHRSAAQGAPDFMRVLGVVYSEETFGRRDPEEAMKWFKLAQAAGDEKASAEIKRLEEKEVGAAAFLKRCGRGCLGLLKAAKKSLYSGKEEGALKGFSVPPPGVNMALWRIQDAEFAVVSHVLPLESLAAQKGVRFRGGKTEDFRYEDPAGDRAVLILRNNKEETPAAEEILERVRRKNEDQKIKHAEELYLRSGEGPAGRFEEIVIFNWRYEQQLFPYRRLEFTRLADGLQNAGLSAVFLRGGLEIEAALHLKARAGETKEELLARTRAAADKWAGTVEVQKLLPEPARGAGGRGRRKSFAWVVPACVILPAILLLSLRIRKRGAVSRLKRSALAGGFALAHAVLSLGLWFSLFAQLMTSRGITRVAWDQHVALFLWFPANILTAFGISVFNPFVIAANSLLWVPVVYWLAGGRKEGGN